MDAVLDLLAFLAEMLPAWRFILALVVTALVAWLIYQQIGTEPYAPYVVGALTVTGFVVGVQWQWGSGSRKSGLS